MHLDPDLLKIGYVILVNTRKTGIERFQRHAGYKESSKWTHVAGCLGGYIAIEGNFPRSRLVDIKKRYLDRGCEVKVVRRKGQEAGKRYKVALWWATMNNLPYDALQFFWYPLTLVWEGAGVLLHKFFSSQKRFLCSELIATGFYKEGDYVFGKPANQVLPADFDNPALFEEQGRFPLPEPLA